MKWIQLVSAGVDHIRELPVWRSDITVTAAQGMHTVPMAEHCISLPLALSRQVPALVRAQDNHEWIHHRRDLQFGELRGKTMGIVGWGKIGDGVAHLARAFGMRIIGTRWSVMVPTQVGALAGVRRLFGDRAGTGEFSPVSDPSLSSTMF